MNLKYLWFAIFICLGCSQQSFQGSSGSALKRPNTDKPGSGNGMTTDPFATDISVGERTETPLCSEMPVSLSFAQYGVAEPFQDNFSQWIYYSAPFVVDLKTTKGLYLPVTTYSVDDVLVLLGANESIAQTGGNAKGEIVTFKLPDGAMVLSDPNQVTGQKGKMAPSSDVFNTKIYLYRGNVITVSRDGLPGRQDLHINDLIPQGMPVVPYNTIDLKDLKSSGYIDEKGVLRVRLGLIPHGHGDLRFRMDVKACP